MEYATRCVVTSCARGFAAIGTLFWPNSFHYYSFLGLFNRANPATRPAGIIRAQSFALEFASQAALTAGDE